MDNLVLVDMDAVLTDFEPNFIAHWFRLFPGEPCPITETQTAFANRATLPPHVRDKVWSVYLTPGLFDTMPVMPGGAEALREMEDAGLRPHICTAPMPGHATCLSEKHAWVGRHMPSFMRDRLIISLDKTLVRGTWLIDDLPNVHGLMRPVWTQILFSAPYNWRTPAKHRLNDWFAWRRLFTELGCL